MKSLQTMGIGTNKQEHSNCNFGHPAFFEEQKQKQNRYTTTAAKFYYET